MNATLATRKPSSLVPDDAILGAQEFARLWLGDVIIVSFGSGRRVALVTKLGRDRLTWEPIAKCFVYSRDAGAWTQNTRKVVRRGYIRFVSHQTMLHHGSGGQEWETPVTDPRNLNAMALIEALGAAKL